MVQVDISQLSQECNKLRDSLRSYRDNIANQQAKLQQFASKQLSKEELQEVEHFQNQFHIQLINIHDLKQSIKMYDRKVNFELATNGASMNESMLNEQERLVTEFDFLSSTLEDLYTGFEQMISVSK